MNNRRYSGAQLKRRKRQIEIGIKCGITTLVLVGVVIFGINHFPDGNNDKNIAKADSKEITKVIEETPTDAVEEEETFEYPVISESYTDIISENVKSPYVALLDVENNEIIAGKNVDAKIYPASMTKVMTLIVAVEHLQDFTQPFTMTAEILDPLYIAEASRAGFEVGDVTNVKDMLYGLILPSGADAAMGLSILTAGSETAFADLMNEKCAELNLKNTHFVNSSGLYDDNQYTTPVEMAMILKYAMENETCREVLSTYQYTTSPVASNPEGILLTSTMFSRMYGDEVENVIIQAGKTGYTMEAKNCLVSYAEKAGHHYIALTAGADNRWHVIYDDFEIYGNYLPEEPSQIEIQEETQEET